MSQSPQCALYSKQCEFTGSLFGFSRDPSIQALTEIGNAESGRKLLVLNVLFTEKME